MGYELRQIRHLEEATPEWEYFRVLQDSGLLKYRLPESARPSIAEMQDIIRQPFNQVFLIFETGNPYPVAECMLNNFQGRMAMIHISAHPGIFGGETVRIGQWVVRELFRSCRYPDGTFLRSLVGLTPETNRLAVRFLQKVGFSVKTTLTNCFTLGNDKERIVSGVLSELRADEV